MVEIKKGGSCWRGRNVLVTGGSGFVGGAIIERLGRQGANTVALVRDFVPKAHLFSSGLYKTTNIVQGELEDASLLRRIMSEYEIQVVYHLAAQTQVLSAVSDPVSTFSANIVGSYNVLEASRNAGSIEAVVLASSDKAYGIPEKLPYTEDMPLKGTFPYDVSKSCTDLIAQSYFHTYGLPVSIARCGNTYGEGDLNFKRLIPKVIKHVRNGMPLVMRSDGTPKRDFVYVQDVVDAYVSLGENAGRTEVRGEAFNFGSGKPHTVREVVELLLKLLGTDMSPQWVKPAEREIPEQYLSNEKAGKILGWKPQFGLEAGLRRTIAWYDEFLRTE